jgi:hypothetical protein
MVFVQTFWVDSIKGGEFSKKKNYDSWTIKVSILEWIQKYKIWLCTHNRTMYIVIDVSRQLTIVIPVIPPGCWLTGYITWTESEAKGILPWNGSMEYVLHS